jgi:hypothetical protein
MISGSLPETLQDLTMFEDFNEDYNTVAYNNPYTSEWVAPPELVRTPAGLVGSTLAQRSQSLEKLTASYMVDAQDFFRVAVNSGYFWGRLSVLSLTSRHLNRFSDVAIVNHMLENAGRVALNMPALTRLDIWNGTKGNVCGFQIRGR